MSTGPSDALECKLAKELSRLLQEDEHGWRLAAYLENEAFKAYGIDLFTEFDGPWEWSWSLIREIRQYVNLAERFSGRSIEFEFAEDLFWQLMPDWRRAD